MNYYDKYLKYKNKYLNLKKQVGGMLITYGVQNRNPDFLHFTSSNDLSWVLNFSSSSPELIMSRIIVPFMHLELDLNQPNDIIIDTINEYVPNQKNNIADAIAFLSNELGNDQDPNVRRILSKLKHLFD
jgi:hypothetical protein